MPMRIDGHVRTVVDLGRVTGRTRVDGNGNLTAR